MVELSNDQRKLYRKQSEEELLRDKTFRERIGELAQVDFDYTILTLKLNTETNPTKRRELEMEIRANRLQYRQLGGRN